MNLMLLNKTSGLFCLNKPQNGLADEPIHYNKYQFFNEYFRSHGYLCTSYYNLLSLL